MKNLKLIIDVTGGRILKFSFFFKKKHTILAYIGTILSYIGSISYNVDVVQKCI